MYIISVGIDNYHIIILSLKTDLCTWVKDVVLNSSLRSENDKHLMNGKTFYFEVNQLCDSSSLSLHNSRAIY